MPFNNSGETHIHGTYNDVAGSQFNNSPIIQVFTSTSTALISRTTANSQWTIDSLATMVAKTGAHSIGSQTIIMPKSKPFRDFIAIILELQATLYPIIEVVGETEDLRVLSQELSRTLVTTTLAGRIIDYLETDWELRLVWCRRLTDKVGRSVNALREVVEIVVQYRSGVRRRLTGSAKEQLWAAVTHFVSGERNIDGIAREVFHKLIDCTNPLERFVYCMGEGLLHQFKYSFNKALWQDLSAAIQSHLTIPRFRSPHGMITRYNRSYPFDSYTTYSDLCMLLGEDYDIHGYVDTATEEILSPKHLSKLIQQRSAPHITVEPVRTCTVIGDINRDNNHCPRCESESSYGEWRVCISCGLRFQKTAPKLRDGNLLHLWRSGQGARYVLAMCFDGSILSSVKRLTAVAPNSAMALRLLRLLSNINSPIVNLSLTISHLRSTLIRNELDTGSSPLILQHLTQLTLFSYNKTFDLPTVSLPQITYMELYLDSTPDSPIINWLLNFRTLTQLNLALQWHHPLGSIQQLLLGLPALKDLGAGCLPHITRSTLAQITETVRSIRAQDHPIRYINISLLKNLAELKLPYPWVVDPWLKGVLDTSPEVVLDTSRL